MNTFGFYGSFLALVDEEREARLNNTVATEQESKMQDASFRKFLIEKAGRNATTVQTIAPHLRRKIVKPQQLIYDDPDYYIAEDMITSTYYVCYRELLMVDLDFYKDEVDPNRERTPEERLDDITSTIEKYCQEHPELRFRLFRSQNGIHAFLISHRACYRDPKWIDLMLDLGADFYYVVFSYLRGWSVRVNRKRRDRSEVLYTYLCEIGLGKTDENLDKLVKLHVNLIPVFKDVPVSLMYGGPQES